MPPTEDEMVADRTELVLEQWPQLSAAYGCLNCDLIFREPVRVAMVGDTTGKCPKCASESVFDVAAALAIERPSLGRVVGAVQGMIERLDAELETNNGER